MVTNLEMNKIDLKKNQLQLSSFLGASALLLAGGAEAAVITGGPLTRTGPSSEGGSTSLVINPTGLVLRVNNTSTGSKEFLGNVSLTSATGFVTGNVGEGTVIGAHLASSSNTYTQAVNGTSGSGLSKVNTGPQNQSRLLGFSFVNAGQTNYGWAKLNINYNGNFNNANALSATVAAFAFENTGKNILAGKPTATTAVPEADTLAMLAAGLGLIGMTASQRRRKFNAANKSESILAA